MISTVTVTLQVKHDALEDPCAYAVDNLSNRLNKWYTFDQEQPLYQSGSLLFWSIHRSAAFAASSSDPLDK